MQNIWFPAPVVVLFRRLVNVVSTLSISHHYLGQRHIETNTNPDLEPRACPTRSWTAFRALDWLSAALGNSHPKLAVALQGDDYSPEPSNRPPSRHRRGHPTLHPHTRPMDQLHTLMNNPVLFDPVRKPRYPIVLCHGLYGFDVRGPSSFPILRTHYWANVLNVLRRRVGAEVIVTGVPGTGSIASRAESMDKVLKERAPGRAINFIAHSMGGLDCRHLISHVKPEDYTPVSLTTVGTPHRGSPFMDWCMENIGLGKLRPTHPSDPTSAESSNPSKSSFTLSLSSLPSSFTTLLLSLLDSPAYANLTSTYLNTIFNPSTPDSPYVKYYSVGGRISSMSVWHPLWLPKMVLDGFEEKEREKGRLIDPNLPPHEWWGNDGLVTVQSARWGEYLGTLEEWDHWSLRGARGTELGAKKVSISIGEGDGWSLGDWTRFVRAWKKEEKSMKGVGAALSEETGPASQAGEVKARKEAETAGEEERIKGKDRESEAERRFADEVVKASTEKLSAVFDWIVEQVPSRNSSAPPPTSPAPGVGRERERPAVPSRRDKSELSSKADLERFYVALCKKLYDEGL